MVSAVSVDHLMWRVVRTTVTVAAAEVLSESVDHPPTYWPVVTAMVSEESVDIPLLVAFGVVDVFLKVFTESVDDLSGGMLRLVIMDCIPVSCFASH